MITLKALILIPLTLWAVHAQATSITTWNTGVDNSGTPRLDNDPELHYSLVAGPTLGVPFVTTSTGGFPIPPWLPDSPVSAWIAPSMDTQGIFNATYTYETTFDLTGFNVGSALFGGQWAEDDFGGQILLNGFDINTFAFGSYTNTTGFDVFSPFTITGGFLPGINKLQFAVTNNGGGPTGLRVEYSGTANRVPEPASLALIGLGLASLGVIRLRNS